MLHKRRSLDSEPVLAYTFRPPSPGVTTVNEFWRRRGVPSGVLAAALLIAFAACSTTTEPTPDPDPDPATLSLVISPTSASVEQGGSTMFDGTATLGGSFSGAVTFSVTGLPAGVTVIIGNVSTSGSTATATIQIQVGAGVSAGVYNGTVTAAGSGVNATAAYALTVTAVATGSYTLTATPSPVSIQRGASGDVAMAIARTIFSEAISLAAEGLPANVTAAFDPAAPTSDASTLTLMVGSGAAAGTSTVTVRGTSSLADVTTTFDLTITDPPAGGFMVDYSNCPAQERPIWAAYSDGLNQPFSVITPVNDVYDLSGLTQDVLGLAVVFEDAADLDVTVDYVDTSGLPTAIDICPVMTTKTVNATLSNTVGITTTTLGPISRITGIDGAVQYIDVPEGNQPFVGFSIDGVGSNDRMVIRRDQDIVDGGTLGTVDFTAEGFAPDGATISFAGIAGGETGIIGMEYAMPRAGGFCAVMPLHNEASAASFTGMSAPAAEMMAGEFHVAGITVGTTTTARSIKESFSTLANRTVTLPPQLATPTITDVTSGGNYLRLEADVNIPAGAEGVTFFDYEAPNRTMTLFYAGGLISGAATLTFPDLSSLSGWDDAWAVPAAATGVNYDLASGFGEDFFTGFASQLCTEGGQLVFTSVFGTYN